VGQQPFERVFFTEEMHTPDHNLVFWFGVGTWEEPKEELPSLVFLVGDG
jgi:hypothetical protein